MTGKFRRIHRWLGLIFSFFVFIAAGSGLVHNLMVYLQSPPPPALPQEKLELSAKLISPFEALEKLEAGLDYSLVSLRQIDGQTWYQFATPGKAPSYVNASSGAVGEAMDERYAEQIATAYLGGMNVRKTDYLTRFNQEYIGIFRILPVYRMDADDGKGTRVYVSTTTGSVTRHTDNQRQLQANIFSVFHKFAFIRDSRLRSIVLTITTSGIALVALSGVILFLRLPSPKRRVAK